MKKLFIVSLLLLFVVSSGYSQEKVDKYSVMASVGASFCLPMGNRDLGTDALKFKDLYKMGLGGTIDVAYPFSKNIAARFELSFNDFMFDKDAYVLRQGYGANMTVTGGGDFIMASKISFCGGVFKPSEKFSFYGIFSIGAYFNMVSNITVTNSNTNLETIIPQDNNVFMGMGVGARFAIKINPKASLFLEPGYETFFPNESWSKATFGRKYDFLSVKAGVTIHPF
jgi:hypothetical protein